MKLHLLVLAIASSCSVFCYVSEFASYTSYEYSILKIEGNKMIEISELNEVPQIIGGVEYGLITNEN